MAGMIVSGESYGKLFYLTILEEKNFPMVKQDFKSIAAEFRPYISPNTLFPIHKVLNSAKRLQQVCVTFRVPI